MSTLVELTDTTFDDQIQNGVVIVDFWAPWCGPCRMQTPILEAVQSKAADGLSIAKVNVDNCPQTAIRFGVQSIPTLIVFNNGREVKRMIGVTDEKTLLTTVNDL